MKQFSSYMEYWKLDYVLFTHNGTLTSGSSTRWKSIRLPDQFSLWTIKNSTRNYCRGILKMINFQKNPLYGAWSKNGLSKPWHVSVPSVYHNISKIVTYTLNDYIPRTDRQAERIIFWIRSVYKKWTAVS